MRTLVKVLIVACVLFAGTSAFAQSAMRPEPVSASIPAYPPMALAKRISGVVLVDVQVNRDGKVTEAIALMGGEYLRDAAVKAALRWRFKPLETKTPRETESPREPHSLDTYSVRLTFIFHDVSYKPPDKKPDFRSPYQIEIFYPELTVDCFNDCP